MKKGWEGITFLFLALGIFSTAGAASFNPILFTYKFQTGEVHRYQMTLRSAFTYSFGEGEEIQTLWVRETVGDVQADGSASLTLLIERVTYTDWMNINPGREGERAAEKGERATTQFLTHHFEWDSDAPQDSVNRDPSNLLQSRFAALTLLGHLLRQTPLHVVLTSQGTITAVTGWEKKPDEKPAVGGVEAANEWNAMLVLMNHWGTDPWQRFVQQLFPILPSQADEAITRFPIIRGHLFRPRYTNQEDVEIGWMMLENSPLVKKSGVPHSAVLEGEATPQHRRGTACHVTFDLARGRLLRQEWKKPIKSGRSGRQEFSGWVERLP